MNHSIWRERVIALAHTMLDEVFGQGEVNPADEAALREAGMALVEGAATVVATLIVSRVVDGREAARVLIAALTSAKTCRTAVAALDALDPAHDTTH